jgi:hypothetical protein
MSNGKLFKTGEVHNPTGGNKKTEYLRQLRETIDFERLIKFVQQIVSGQIKDNDGKKADLKTRGMLAMKLIDKGLPDQKAVEVGGKDGQPISLTIKHYD